MHIAPKTHSWTATQALCAWPTVALLIWLIATGTLECPGATNVQIAAVSAPEISLNGEWKITLDPPEKFWENGTATESWDKIPVPGELHANGFKVEYDKPFVYGRHLDVPADFAGQKILLHFDAVYNHARVWVNGQPVAVHQGGFTPWDCDITEVVRPGSKAWLTIAVTSLQREISFAGKAQRNIGGILRDVVLQARPATFLDDLVISTTFDREFRDAKLHITGTVAGPDANKEVVFRLFEPQGREVPLAPGPVALVAARLAEEIEVKAPQQWDAEHPRLYRLQIDLRQRGASASYASYSRKIGFRAIAFDSNHNLLVNGRVVKLRGVDRHVEDPVRGKVPTAQYDRMDALLIKEANMNFVRTSHYPPGERFIEYCDEIGLYVDLETAVVDVGKKNRPSVGMNDDPQYEQYFLSQLREMIATYGSHASTVIWSIGNESVYGRNFKASYDLVKNLDPSRPVIASYQVVKDEKNESYDIESHHYPAWNEDFSAVSRPTIYDEWMHVLGHGAEAWFHDPNGRDYWGRSLDQAWTNLFPANGSIGAAIWQWVDCVVYMPTPLGSYLRAPTRFLSPDRVRFATPKPVGNVFGVARWGLVDEWRRKKPEFWNTQKAYSPVRVLERVVRSFAAGQPLSLPIYNRFDHTDLNEITVRLEYAGKVSEKACDSLAPHEKGRLVLPAQNWREGTSLTLTFVDAQQRLIDVERIQLGAAALPESRSTARTPEDGAPVTVSDGERIIVRSGAAGFEFSRALGLLEAVTVGGKRHSVRGPFMLMYQNIEYRNMEKRLTSESSFEPRRDDWKCRNIDVARVDGTGMVTVQGSVGGINATYVFTINGNGQCNISYSYDGIPLLSPEGRGEVKPLILEFGIQFEVEAEKFDELFWSRKGYWSWYAEGHLGALEGRVRIWSDRKPTYRQQPTRPWEMDVHDYFYQGVNVPVGRLMPNIARAAKMDIYNYRLVDNATAASLSVLGDGDLSCRLTHARDQKYYLQILDVLDYNLRWGNYSAAHEAKPVHQGRVTLRFDARLKE